MGPQGLPELFVATLADEVKIELANGGSVTVRVVCAPGAVVSVNGGNTVVGRRVGSNSALSNATVKVLERCGFTLGELKCHALREGPENPNRPRLTVWMRAKNRVWVVVRSRGDAIQISHGYFFRWTFKT